MDGDERTTTMGLFNVADSYLRAAVALHSVDTRATHPETPIRFLCFHCIELFLKAFLRANGHSVAELRGRRFGHRICCLWNRATELGVKFSDHDKAIFSWMSSTDAVIESRYIVTGYRCEPTYKDLAQTCSSVRQLIGNALRSRNVMVRLRRSLATFFS